MTRRSHYNHRVCPTKRDRAVLAYIGCVGLASGKQIQRAFWPRARVRTCQERLTRLVHAGLLGTATTTARAQPETIYWLERSARPLTPLALTDMLVVGRPPMAEEAHLLRTRATLDWLGPHVRSFTHEHALKAERAHSVESATRDRTHVADGRITLVPAGGEGDTSGHEEILLEVDGAYFGARLREKVRALSACGERVLWVCFSARRLATVQVATQFAPHIDVVLLADA